MHSSNIRTFSRKDRAKKHQQEQQDDNENTNKLNNYESELIKGFQHKIEITHSSSLSSQHQNTIENASGNIPGKLWKEYCKGSDDHKSFIHQFFLEDVSKAKLKIPGSWSLEKQQCFAEWCRLLGCESSRLGGYLWVAFSKENISILLACWNKEHDALSEIVIDDIIADDDTLEQVKREEIINKTETIFVIAEEGGETIPLLELDEEETSSDNNEEEEEEEDGDNELTNKNTITSEEEEDNEQDDFVAELPKLKLKQTFARPKVEQNHKNRQRSWQRKSTITSEIPLPSHELVEQLEQLNFTWDEFLTEYASGEYLNEGAYKTVYRAVNAKYNRNEAISVMDLNKIEEYGNLAVVKREVAVSVVLSDLVARNKCPNFIEIFHAGEFSTLPIWSQKQQQGSKFQYICMEFCNLGDLEEFTKKQPDCLIPIEDVRSIMFQMIFSLFAGRVNSSLRHYDVKLLNYFLKSGEKPLEFLHYGIAGKIFSLPQRYVVKLGDYGTSDISPDTLGDKIQVDHFTTLENTAMEYLLHADAPQSFEADTFALGLSVFHLFTGGCPYEEIMQEVKCPEALRDGLAEAWSRKGFEAIRTVIEDDECDTLFHTLYRYVVLFGSGGGVRSNFGPKGPVWAEVKRILGLGQSNSVAYSNSDSGMIKLARQQFVIDRSSFSLLDGTNVYINRARERLKQSDGAWDLFLSLVSFDPQQRPTMLECLKSSFFEVFMKENLSAGPGLKFMEYFEISSTSCRF